MTFQMKALWTLAPIKIFAEIFQFVSFYVTWVKMKSGLRPEILNLVMWSCFKDFISGLERQGCLAASNSVMLS